MKKMLGIVVLVIFIVLLLVVGKNLNENNRKNEEKVLNKQNMYQNIGLEIREENDEESVVWNNI